jgi:hypothetical protein
MRWLTSSQCPLYVFSGISDLSVAAFLPVGLRLAYAMEELLGGLLVASLTGVPPYAPIRGMDGTLVGFTISLLNSAAGARMLGQPPSQQCVLAALATHAEYGCSCVSSRRLRIG